MKRVHWFIDTWMFDNRPDEERWRLANAISLLDVDVTYIQFIPHKTNIREIVKTVDDTKINLVYGTHGFLRAMRQTFPNQFRAYCPEDRLKCSNYYTKIPEHMLLNAGGIFMPWKLVKEHPKRIQRMVWGDIGRNGLGQPPRDIFVRPDTGVKTFTGTVLPENDWEYEVNTIDKLSGVTDNTLCYVARTYNIQAEYRFVVVNREVISGSRYRLNDEISLEEVTTNQGDPMAFWLAKEFAETCWQPDVAYTCDVAIVNQIGVTRNVQARIIELNSFSCAGLYYCDYAKVLAAVTQAAIDEDEGKVWIED